MFKRLINYLKYNYLLKLIKPEIIGGFKNPNGIFCPRTRFSNLTHISNKGNNLNIGDNVFIGHYNYIDAYNAKVIICKNTQITNYVSILSHSSHHTIRFFENENASNEKYISLFNVGEVYIGENSYLGPHCVIMPGTRIGKGCIVSAFSYVKGEFPDFSVIRGMPAKVVGNTKEIDQELLNKYPELAQTYYDKDETDQNVKRS